jgi:replicative DNA helicase
MSEAQQDRPMPQDLDAEKAVLATCLSEPSAVVVARELLPEAALFHHRIHRAVWSAIVALDDVGVIPDQVTLTDQLERTGKLGEVGGSAEVAAFCRNPTVASNIKTYCLKVRETYQRRGWITGAEKVRDAAFAPHVVPEQIGSILSSMSTFDVVVPPYGGRRGETQSPDGWTRATAQDLRNQYVRTKFLVENLVPERGICIMAGSPGIGKTWVSLDIALAVATGTRTLGRFPTREGSVLTVLEEEDPAQL